jgi:MinD-like ATPase involved in chromosome partitioning or flagellar assembly
VYTITFYSFKGGVGRTLALVNVAAELARMGRKVLLVDFDLEAPGLETFKRLRPQRPPQPHPGLVEYVTKYMSSKRSPDVRNYIYSAGKVGKKGGELLVMPAGCRDANFQRDLTRLNWKKLYEDCEGFLFFEDTKAQWEQEYKPDYVLIDSRTGHTDVKGICTRQLPDAVVVMFFPNKQNLVGLRAVCQEIDSEREHGLKKSIGLHFVMSNVPDLDDEDKVLRRLQNDFEKELDIAKLSAVIHRYESTMLFDQEIFVLKRPRSRLAREYRKLTRALIRHNPADREGALQFLRGGSYTLSNEDLSYQGFPAGHALLPKILELNLDDADMIYEVAVSACDKRREVAQTIGLLDRVLALKPDHVQALIERAELKQRAGDVSGAAADLLQCVRDHGLKIPKLERPKGVKVFYLAGEDLGLSVLRDLRTVAPEQLPEAVDCAIARGIEPESKYQLAQFLAETDSGLPRAIQLMSDYLADENSSERSVAATFLLQSYQIRARRWREVVNQYDAKAVAVDQASSWAESFNVAMAHWAQGRTAPEAFCREIIRAMPSDEEWNVLGKYKPLVCEWEGECWLLWWIGNNQEALHSLGVWIEHIEKMIEDRNAPSSWWSFWGYRGVELSQYLDDMQQLRRMIQGEPIRPPFLGAPAEAK